MIFKISFRQVDCQSLKKVCLSFVSFMRIIFGKEGLLTEIKVVNKKVDTS